MRISQEMLPSTDENNTNNFSAYVLCMIFMTQKGEMLISVLGHVMKHCLNDFCGLKIA